MRSTSRDNTKVLSGSHRSRSPVNTSRSRGNAKVELSSQRSRSRLPVIRSGLRHDTKPACEVKHTSQSVQQISRSRSPVRRSPRIISKLSHIYTDPDPL